MSKIEFVGIDCSNDYIDSLKYAIEHGHSRKRTGFFGKWMPTLEMFIRKNNIEQDATMYVNEEKIKVYSVAGNYAMKKSMVFSHKYTARGLEIITDYN